MKITYKGNDKKVTIKAFIAMGICLLAFIPYGLAIYSGTVVNSSRLSLKDPGISDELRYELIEKISTHEIIMTIGIVIGTIMFLGAIIWFYFVLRKAKKTKVKN